MAKLFLDKHDLSKLTCLRCHSTCFLYLVTIIFAQLDCIIYKPSDSIQIMEVVSLCLLFCSFAWTTGSLRGVAASRWLQRGWGWQLWHYTADGRSTQRTHTHCWPVDTTTQGNVCFQIKQFGLYPCPVLLSCNYIVLTNMLHGNKSIFWISKIIIKLYYDSNLLE